MYDPPKFGLNQSEGVGVEAKHTGKRVCGINLVRQASCCKHIVDCTWMNLPLPPFNACVNSQIKNCPWHFVLMLTTDSHFMHFAVCILREVMS